MGEVDPRFRHQGCQAGNEIQWLEDDVRRAVTVRRLQLEPDVAIRGERQSFFRDRWPADVSTQALELLAFICTCRDTGV